MAYNTFRLGDMVMDDLGSMIKLARERAGLTRKQLAEKTGLAVVTIGQYERGVRNPKEPQLRLLADALGVTTDLFSQLDEPYIPDPVDPESPLVDDNESICLPIIEYGPNLGENIRSARKASRMTQAELAKRVGVSLRTIQQYESGLRRPRVGHLKRLADIFGTSAYKLAQNDKATQADNIPTEKIRLKVEDAYLEKFHGSQWLRVMTQDGKETLHFYGKLNEILSEMTPESVELVADFAEFVRRREAEYFRRSNSPPKTE